MNIRQYQLLIEAHEFLHESNQYISRSKYSERPDTSCQTCHPVLRTNLPAAFLKFWEWYRNKYNAVSITSYTVNYFEKAINSIDESTHRTSVQCSARGHPGAYRL